MQEFDMQVTFDAMCDMLISVTDTKLLQDIEQKCNDVSNMMLSFPAMIPGSRYYKGMKVVVYFNSSVLFSCQFHFLSFLISQQLHLNAGKETAHANLQQDDHASEEWNGVW